MAKATNIIVTLILILGILFLIKKIEDNKESELIIPKLFEKPSSGLWDLYLTKKKNEISYNICPNDLNNDECQFDSYVNVKLLDEIFEDNIYSLFEQVFNDANVKPGETKTLNNINTQSVQNLKEFLETNVL